MRPPLYQLKAESLRMLGHPVRIRVLEQLRQADDRVGAIGAASGTGAPPERVCLLNGCVS